MERKGLVLVICWEQQPASSATSIGADAGKEQALGRDMDSPGPAHLGFSFGLQVVLYNTARTPSRLPLSYFPSRGFPSSPQLDSITCTLGPRSTQGHGVLGLKPPAQAHPHLCQHLIPELSTLPFLLLMVLLRVF